jgi:hypothetical protein
MSSHGRVGRSLSRVESFTEGVFPHGAELESSRGIPLLSAHNPAFVPAGRGDVMLSRVWRVGMCLTAAAWVVTACDGGDSAADSAVDAAVGAGGNGQNGGSVGEGGSGQGGNGQGGSGGEGGSGQGGGHGPSGGGGAGGEPVGGAVGGAGGEPSGGGSRARRSGGRPRPSSARRVVSSVRRFRRCSVRWPGSSPAQARRSAGSGAEERGAGGVQAVVRTSAAAARSRMART